MPAMRIFFMSGMAGRGLRVLRELRSAESGSNAVEFALVAPVLVLIAFGIVHFGMLISAAHSISQIAADAARYAMVGRTPDERLALVAEHIDAVGNAYPVSPRSLLSFEVVETSGAMRVVVVQDVSGIPPMPMMSVVYDEPDRIVRSALVMLP